MMKVWLYFMIAFLLASEVSAQTTSDGELIVVVEDSIKKPVAFATVELFNIRDSSLIKAQSTDSAGKVLFNKMAAGNYYCRISLVNYKIRYIPFTYPDQRILNVQLQAKSSILEEVTVEARKPLFQQLKDKLLINVEAGITNAGTTVMEVLEKSPGVSIDRDGNIQLNGRQGVLVLIDGRQTYTSGSDLVNMLSGMNAQQVEQIEIMDNPSSKYDAAGNAGIINLKTKKSRQKGFNGSISTSFGQGRYPKSNNSLQLNYRNGNLNYFFTYSLNASEYITDLYALRSYYKEDGKTIEALLEQPTFIKGTSYTHTLRTGFDYSINKKSTAGISLSGMQLKRDGNSTGIAEWMNEEHVTDSLIDTRGVSRNTLQNGGLNVNFRHSFNASTELTANIDALTYRIGNNQYFENVLKGANGYTEAIRGELPGWLHIYSGKADYTARYAEGWNWATGWKSAHITTNNRAEYFYKNGGEWQEDLGRTNHFLYSETIHALYGNIEKQWNRLTLQGGLRFEHTGYEADQLGNASRKDSSFSRRYSSVFPSVLISYDTDSLNSFTFSAGRRIDRPVFQKLNPFVFVINKYTNQTGNPFFLPQYTWNLELTHSFKEMINTTVSYSATRNYFSQIFLSDSTGIMTYTEGNLGKMNAISVNINGQIPLFPWWSLSATANVTHKKIDGFLWKAYSASITQMQLNINNQLSFNRGWSAEISGFYNTRSQYDLQEVLDPTGQLSVGIGKQVLKNKGTIKLSLRDIFYTQAMEGWTVFQQAGEYFKLLRDSRVCTLAFTYRFGKALKTTSRTVGGAGDEIQRVGTGG